MSLIAHCLKSEYSRKLARSANKVMLLDITLLYIHVMDVYLEFVSIQVMINPYTLRKVYDRLVIFQWARQLPNVCNC